MGREVEQLHQFWARNCPHPLIRLISFETSNFCESGLGEKSDPAGKKIIEWDYLWAE